MPVITTGWRGAPNHCFFGLSWHWINLFTQVRYYPTLQIIGRLLTFLSILTNPEHKRFLSGEHGTPSRTTFVEWWIGSQEAMRFSIYRRYLIVGNIIEGIRDTELRG